MSGLTPRQTQCLDAIQSLKKSLGCTPSYDQISTKLGMRSKGSVHRLIEALVIRGAIRRIPGQSRGLQVVDPENRSDLLAFMDQATREMVMKRSTQSSVTPEMLIATICRQHFFR